MFSRRFDADARRRFGKKFARKYRRNDMYLHIAKTVRRFVIVFNKYAPNTFREFDFFTSTFFVTIRFRRVRLFFCLLRGNREKPQSHALYVYTRNYGVCIPYVNIVRRMNLVGPMLRACIVTIERNENGNGENGRNTAVRQNRYRTIYGAISSVKQKKKSRVSP